MADIYAKLKELGLELPKAPAKGGVYSPTKEFSGKLVYVSGCGPVIDQLVTGKAGEEFTKDEAKEYAKNSMLNVLAVLQAQVGDLNKIKHPVKILVFVASADNFYDQPYVANGGSELLAELFGKDAVPSRSAIGVNVLPGNIPVETEAIFELE